MKSNPKHSPGFVKEMEVRLQQEKKNLETELAVIGHSITGEREVNFPDYGRNDEDNASEIADYQAAASTEKTLTSRLKEVNQALERIAKDTYGLTDDGDLIPEKRLRANPAATSLVK